MWLNLFLQDANLPYILWPVQRAIFFLDNKHKSWAQEEEGGRERMKDRYAKLIKIRHMKKLGVCRTHRNFQNCEFSWLDEMNSYFGTSLTCALRVQLKTTEIILLKAHEYLLEGWVL
jgi:hypothetical protein